MTGLAFTGCKRFQTDQLSCAHSPRRGVRSTVMPYGELWGKRVHGGTFLVPIACKMVYMMHWLSGMAGAPSAGLHVDGSGMSKTGGSNGAKECATGKVCSFVELLRGGPEAPHAGAGYQLQAQQG